MSVRVASALPFAQLLPALLVKVACWPVFVTLRAIGPCSTDRHQGSVTQLAHTRARCLGSFDEHVDSVRESSHFDSLDTRWNVQKRLVAWEDGESEIAMERELAKESRRVLWRMSRHSLTSCTARHFLSLLNTLHVCMLRAEKNRHDNMGGTSSLAGCCSIPPTACACE